MIEVRDRTIITRRLQVLREMLKTLKQEREKLTTRINNTKRWIDQLEAKNEFPDMKESWGLK